jgi:hypothetical protein
MEKEKIIKKIKLTNIEKGLVKAIWDYLREGGEIGDSVDDFGYKMLSDLQCHILSEHGYEESHGEYADWDRDSWESIIVYYDKEMEETENKS